MPPPATVVDEQLAAALSSMWCIDDPALSYVPKGVGSYHWVVTTRTGHEYFVTVDDLDTKPWLGRSRDTTFEGLVDAYATARLTRRPAGRTP